MTERGTVLGGRYELDQIIGRGGMAEVWRARDRRLVRDVAVKRLRVDLASDPTFQARFRREAQSAAGLNHPNIVAVYDTGEEVDGKSDVSVPYIVMELVEGVTLRDVLRDGRKILPQRALEFTRGVLDALAYSHRAGIIHRDIKPANVMLTPDGSVKVMDFGIARAVADTSATMTQTAAVIGTAQYLSPEQARGEKVDNRSDIYSVGCLLYELLVSQPPFKGDSPVSVAYQHVRETPVAPSTLDPEITPDMDAVVLKALAKDPADRYQDAREFSDDVTRAMRGEPVHAVPAAVEAPTAVLAGATQTHVAQRAAVDPVTPLSPIEDDLEDEDEERKPRTGIIVLASLAGLLVVGMIVAIAMIMNPRTPEVATVAVPPVIGLNEAAATAQIEQADLLVDVTFAPGTEEDNGQVIDQNPDAGTPVELQTTVTITISTGPVKNVIPETIIGMPEAAARDVLDAHGFTNVRSELADPRTEPIDANVGEVTAVSPPQGAEVEPDSEIVLTVATGRSLVPTLRGMTVTEARDTAKLAGFDNVDVTEEETDAQPAGVIFDQTPLPNQALDRSETIHLKVAVAPDPRVLVPDLFGLNEAQARDTAFGEGFTITEVLTEETDQYEPGTVFRQNPAKDELRDPRETPITITIAAAPPTQEPSVDPEPTESATLSESTPPEGEG